MCAHFSARHGLSQMNASPLLHTPSLHVPSTLSEPQSSPSLHCRRKDWQLQPPLSGTLARQFWYAPFVAVQLVAVLLANAQSGRKLSPVSPLPPGLVQYQVPSSALSVHAGSKSPKPSCWPLSPRSLAPIQCATLPPFAWRNSFSA